MLRFGWAQTISGHPALALLCLAPAVAHHTLTTHPPKPHQAPARGGEVGVLSAASGGRALVPVGTAALYPKRCLCNGVAGTYLPLAKKSGKVLLNAFEQNNHSLEVKRTKPGRYLRLIQVL